MINRFDPYLVLGQVVRKVGNHDLGLGGNAILGRTALLLGTRSTGLASLASLAGSGVVLVGDLGQRSGLAGNVDGLSGGLTVLRLRLMFGLA